MTKVYVSKIYDFSFVDGPGNRMAIFLQGCNFNCEYCHNPETINYCTNCGFCTAFCENKAIIKKDNVVKFYSENCCDCGCCIDNCPNFSNPKTKSYTIDELFQYIQKKTRLYKRSNFFRR